MKKTDTVLILTHPRDEGDVETLEILSTMETRLDEDGQNAVFREFDGKALRAMPKAAPRTSIAYFPNRLPDNLKALIARIRKHYGDAADMTLIGVLPAKTAPEITALFDTALFSPAHPAQITMRIKALQRLASMQDELKLRRSTLFNAFNIAPPPANDARLRPPKILFVGKPAPEFMTIIHALQEKSAEVVAAFTSFTAFDYLHEQDFDAVVLAAFESQEPALTITATMRRNSKLYHTPTLMLSKSKKGANAGRAYEMGVNDILISGAPTEEISGRILELANYHRAHDQMKTDFGAIGGAACLDAATGLYNAAFIGAHFENHCNAQTAPLSMAVFKVIGAKGKTLSPEQIRIAAPQIGTMLRSLVRVEDCAARLAPDSFAVLFPGESAKNAQIAADRIGEIIACTGFDGAEKTFTVLLENNVVETTLAQTRIDAQKKN